MVMYSSSYCGKGQSTHTGTVEPNIMSTLSLSLFLYHVSNIYDIGDTYSLEFVFRCVLLPLEDGSQK